MSNNGYNTTLSLQLSITQSIPYKLFKDILLSFWLSYITVRGTNTRAFEKYIMQTTNARNIMLSVMRKLSFILLWKADKSDKHISICGTAIETVLPNR